MLNWLVFLLAILSVIAMANPSLADQPPDSGPKIDLPQRPASQGYIRSPREMQTYVPDHSASLASDPAMFI